MILAPALSGETMTSVPETRVAAPEGVPYARACARARAAALRLQDVREASFALVHTAEGALLEARIGIAPGGDFATVVAHVVDGIVPLLGTEIGAVDARRSIQFCFAGRRWPRAGTVAPAQVLTIS